MLGPNFAVAAIDIDARARNAGHYVLIETDDQLVSSDFTIRPLDPTEPLPPNEAPVAVLAAPDVVAAHRAFAIQVEFVDGDDQFIQGLVVIMDMVTTAEVFGSGFFFVDTSGEKPVQVEFKIDGLPPGDYKYVVLPNDGLAAESPIEQLFTVVGCQWDCEAVPNGLVGTSDLLALLAGWGGPGDCDFDGGGVGTSDLLKLLANWGQCP